MSPRRPLLAAAFVVAAVVGARADGSAETFRRAELEERAVGNLEAAARLYRDAAAGAATAEDRARAELRAASCLRRLGRADEARALASPWTAERPGVPEALRRMAEEETAAAGAAPPAAPRAADPAASDAAARLAEIEADRDRTRERLEASLTLKESELAALAQQLKDKDAAIARLRAEVPPPPETPEEVIARRRREMERRRERNEATARAFLKVARAVYEQGRFDEARVYLYDALTSDPDNAEARALLSRVSAPLGAGETLFGGALALAALARDVRAARRAAEVSALVEEARRRHARGDFAGAAPSLESALAVLDAWPDLVRGGAALRDDVQRMLQAGVARGVPRAPAAPPEPDAPEARWTQALADLLADAGGEVAQGLVLRFHELTPVLAKTSLVPVAPGVGTTGWTVSVDAEPEPLLAAWLRAEEGRALAAPSASLSLVGSTCAVLADAATQRRIAERLEALRHGALPPADVQIGAYRVDRAGVAERLRARGVESVALASGARAAALDPQDFTALFRSDAGGGGGDAALPSIATGIVGLARLRATPLRAFRLSAGPPHARVTVDPLVVPGARPGVGVRVAVAAAPREHPEGPVLRSETLAGGTVAPGGGLVVFGVPDPEGAGDVAVVVRVGNAPAASGVELPPPAPPSEGADWLQLPRGVGAVEDPPPPPLLVPEHPVPSRAEALLRRLRQAHAGVRTVEMRGDRVLVVGSEEARAAVTAFLARFDGDVPAAALDVRFHQVAPRVEKALAQLAPRLVPAAGGGARWTVLAAGRESRDVAALLADARGEVPRRDATVAPPPTGRDDAVRIVRTAYRSGPGTADGGARWGRGETSWVDEGLLVSVRSFGVRADGRADLDVAARARWIADPGRRDADAPAGSVPVLDPRTASWWADLSAPLARGETLLLLDAASPFAAGDATRVVVTVRLAE